MKTIVAVFAMLLVAGTFAVRSEADARRRADYVESLYDAYPNSTEQFSVAGMGNRILVVHDAETGPADLDAHLAYLVHNSEVANILKQYGFEFVAAGDHMEEIR